MLGGRCVTADVGAPNDLNRLHPDIHVALIGVIPEAETIRVVINGMGKAGLVATDSAAYIYSKGGWRRWPYEVLDGVDLQKGFKSCLALAGPSLPSKAFGFSDFGKLDYVIQTKSDKVAETLAPEVERLIRNVPSVGAAEGKSLIEAEELGVIGPAQTRSSHMPGDSESLIIEAEGNGGHVWVFPDKIRIKHHGLRGLMTKGFQKGDKDVWIDQIAGIQWRNPGSLWLGHIQFELIGGSTAAKTASEDENAVMFDSSRREAFERVKVEVEQRMRAIRLERTRPAAAAAPQVDIPDQIKKLAELRDAGIISADEFEQKKNDLLSRM
ncbi:MAG: hypothetical protein QOJ81_218 [Chloroflexota bacterium]|nr:hypothetical protein [Chloroflexota bacterium]